MKKILTLFAAITLLNLMSCSERSGQPAWKVEVQFSEVLSTNGSTRATAYMMSNKIISTNDKIYISWLDRVADIQIKEYDKKSDAWSETFLIGTGVDNHSGPAITMDSEGFIHAVFGPHHGPFQYRKTSNPNDISRWDSVQFFGVNGTYPSMICDDEDNLHIAYRGGAEPRRLMYQKKTKNEDWSDPIELLDSKLDTGYTQYGNSLIISPNGVIHLAFHIYDQQPPGGKALGYLRSNDRGQTWENSQGLKIDLPATPDSPCFIEQGAQLDMRCGNLAIDSDGNPWLTAFHNEKQPRSTVLWHHDGSEWQGQEMLDIIKHQFPEWEILYSSITFDQDGMLYIVSAIQKAFSSTYWGDPSLEIILLTSPDRAKTFQIIPVSKIDPNLPNWLPNIERPYGQKQIGAPSFLYTHGGPGVGVTEGAATEVIFVKLKKVLD